MDGNTRHKNFAGGTPVTKPFFVAQLNKSLAWAGLSSSSYKGHSFRIGAATTAAIQGSRKMKFNVWSDGNHKHSKSTLEFLCCICANPKGGKESQNF